MDNEHIDKYNPDSKYMLHDIIQKRRHDNIADGIYERVK